MVGRSARVLAVLALVVVCSLPVSAQEASALVTLRGDAVGEDLTRGDLIAVFFASWSPRCRGVVEQANSLERSWGGQASVVLVAFQEEAEEVESFLVDKDPRVQVLRDPRGAFSKQHGVTTLPSLLVIRDGATVFRGRFPADPGTVLARIFD